jgi:ribonuclease Z
VHGLNSLLGQGYDRPVVQEASAALRESQLLFTNELQHQSELSDLNDILSSEGGEQHGYTARPSFQKQTDHVHGNLQIQVPPRRTNESSQHIDTRYQNYGSSTFQDTGLEVEVQPRVFRATTYESPAGRRRRAGAFFDPFKKSVGKYEKNSTPDTIVFREKDVKKLQAFGALKHTDDLPTFTKMRSWVQVITTPTADTQGTTLIIHFQSKRYMVGSLAEGTQRAAVQAGAKLLKVQDFFVTGRTEWKNVGGMIGVILTVADSTAASQSSALEEAVKKARGKAVREGFAEDPEKMRQVEEEAKKTSSNKIRFFGPPNMNHMLATTRRFVFRKGMPLDIHEIRADKSSDSNSGSVSETQERWKPTWMDENIKVWAMANLPKPFTTQTATSSVSPRKRSSDEAFATDVKPVPIATTKNPYGIVEDLSVEDRNYLTVKAVVGEMFDSSWRLDTLHETPLSEVKLPATIFIRDPVSHKIVQYPGPLPGQATLPDPDLKVLVRQPWPGALVESLPSPAPAKESISYVISNHPQRGKFDPKRAKQLGLKSGPAFSQLTKGDSVVNDKGETITPDMVIGEGKEGGGIAVLDIPHVDYIENTLSRAEWHEPQVMAGVGAIFWICGPEVAKHPQVHAFMHKFKHLEHSVSSPDYCPNNIALESTASSTVMLRKLDPDRYAIPVHDGRTPEGELLRGASDHAVSTTETHPLPDGVHIAARGHILDLEPSIKYSTKWAASPFVVADAEAEVPAEALAEAEVARTAIATYDEKMESWINSLPPGSKDAEIIALGTGSALPSKYRNVSATLVLVPGWGNILFDCGENTLGQLKRVFTETELAQVFRDLRILSISHMHADHHLGTTGVIKAWYQQVHGGQPGATHIPGETTSDVDMHERFRDQHRLAVISEPAMQAWLYEYSQLEDYGYSRIAPLVLTNTDLRRLSSTGGRLDWFTQHQILNDLDMAGREAHLSTTAVPLSLLNLAKIEAVRVTHCHGARAVSITLPSGFKVSFSGDCRPSRDFAHIGQGSTVCIHEATFDDELKGDAVAKKHSTTSEALGIAERMQARACVLTHFSQRYQKVPILERSEATDVEDVEIPLASDTVDEAADAEALNDGALEDDMTYAAQTGSAGADSAGQQYDLGNGKPPTMASKGSKPGEAVKLQLKSNMKVCVAFDYMRVKVGDIGHLEKFTPAMTKLFEVAEVEAEDAIALADGAAEVDNKANKKQEKKIKGGRRNN